MPAKKNTAKQPIVETKDDERSVSSSENEVKKPVKRTVDHKKEAAKNEQTQLAAPDNTPEVNKCNIEWDDYPDEDEAKSALEETPKSDDKRVYRKVNAGPFQPNTQRRTGRVQHTVASAINFSYNQYRDLNTCIKTLPTQEVLKVLIVRSYDQGQSQLCDTLKQTLRAMNLECNFPQTEKAMKFATMHENQNEESHDRQYTRPNSRPNARPNFQNPRFGRGGGRPHHAEN